jgi:hypothetical protein
MAGSSSPRTGARDRGRPVTHWVAVPRFRLRRPGVASAWNQRRRAPDRRRVCRLCFRPQGTRRRRRRPTTGFFLQVVCSERSRWRHSNRDDPVTSTPGRTCGIAQSRASGCRCGRDCFHPPAASVPDRVGQSVSRVSAPSAGVESAACRPSFCASSLRARTSPRL